MLRQSVLLILFCIIIAIVLACKGPASWCTDPSGQDCRTGTAETTATLEFNAQEDEEVVEEHEHVVQANTAEYEADEEQSQFFSKFKLPKFTGKLGKPLVPVKPKFNIDAFASAIKKRLGFSQNYECHSDCRWIRTEQMVCDKCKYPWALYNKSSNNGECVMLRNIWSLMRNNPEAISKYANRCKADAMCQCKKPTPPSGGGFFSSFIVAISNAVNRIQTAKKYCQYQCKDFIVDIHPQYLAVYQALKKEVEAVTVTVDKEAFDPALQNGVCPKKNDVAAPMSSDQRESLVQYCFYMAKDSYKAKNNLTEEQFNAKVSIFSLMFGRFRMHSMSRRRRW